MPDIFFMIMRLMMLLMKSERNVLETGEGGFLTRALIPGGAIPQSRFPVRTGAVR